MSETVNRKTASQRLLTAEDLYGLPDGGTIQELLEGCLPSEPLPGARHGRITVVDPDSQCVAVYRELLHPRILKRDETLEAEDLLPGFSVRVGELFEI